MDVVLTKLLFVLSLFGILQQYGLASKEFKQYSVTRPFMIHERAKRDVDTRNKDGHLKKVKVGFRAFAKDFLLDLHQNLDLIPTKLMVKHQQNGKSVIDESFNENSHCYYHGKIVGNPDSWVALSTCKGLSGVVFDGSEMHFIEKSKDKISNLHFVYRESDLIPRNMSIGVAEESSTKDPLANIHKRVPRDVPPSNDYFKYDGPWYLELIIAADNRVFKKMDEDKDATIEKIKNIANIINALYKPLKINVALVGIDIWSESEAIVFDDDNSDTTLANFLRYKREQLSPKIPNDSALLITGNSLGTLNGKALTGTICTHQYSGGISMDRDMDTALLAATMAHTLSHNLGIKHDTDECECPSNRCIVSTATSTVLPTDWSSCSFEYLRTAFGRGMDYCLRNKPSTVIGPVCGNGFIEDGEECDCGLSTACDNLCCDASTCKKYDNATCASGHCCDLSTCQVNSKGTVCRQALGECDLPEQCDGTSEVCPNDVYVRDGSSCDIDELHCYHGRCRSHDDQCNLLWGDSGTDCSTLCYDLNVNGNSKGDCGYNQLDQTYKACEEDDILCGRLHCFHLNESLKIGYDAASAISTSTVEIGDELYLCSSAVVDFGLNSIDPGLVPDGAKCGSNKICVGQKCVSVDSLDRASCDSDCSGHGMCDNEGTCHCDDGYEPPACTESNK